MAGAALELVSDDGAGCAVLLECVPVRVEEQESEIELYLLKGALPGSYQVRIHIDPVNLDCSAPALDLPTATLQTNAAGNGFADHVFSPADADGLRGHTVSAFWTVTGPASYRTGCSLVTLD